jgi:hypothetical protein
MPQAYHRGDLAQPNDLLDYRGSVDEFADGRTLDSDAVSCSKRRSRRKDDIRARAEDGASENGIRP